MYNKLLSSNKTFMIIPVVLLTWILETAIHIFLFSDDTLMDALVFKVSMHELYMRLLIMMSLVMLFFVIIKNRIIKDKEVQIENILRSVLPICITNLDYEIIMANDSYWSIWEPKDAASLKCYDHRPGEHCHTEKCALTQIMKGSKEFSCESKKEFDKEVHHYIVTARPYYGSRKKMIGIIESFQDITPRKNLENEKENLIDQLKESLAKVKLLSGFIPICSSCKKIRDDKGYWNHLEAYLRDHSEAEFSHGICPDCAEKLYPGFYKKKQDGIKKNG